MSVDPELERSQVERLDRWRNSRDAGALDAALIHVREIAASDTNLLPAMRSALELGATVGEVSDVLRGVFGVHRPA